MAITAATGPGTVVRGQAAVWTAVVELTACQDLARVQLRPADLRFNGLEGLTDVRYYEDGRLIRNFVRVGKLTAGETYRFELGVSGVMPAAARGRVDLAPAWQIEYVIGRTSQIRWTSPAIVLEAE
jgi:hypothetical protein